MNFTTNRTNHLPLSPLLLLLVLLAFPSYAATITPKYDKKPEYQKYWTANLKNQVSKACQFLAGHINDNQPVTITFTIDSAMNRNVFARADLSNLLGTINTADELVARTGKVAFNPSFYDETRRDWQGNNISQMMQEVLQDLRLSDTINAFKKYINVTSDQVAGSNSSAGTCTNISFPSITIANGKKVPLVTIKVTADEFKQFSGISRDSANNPVDGNTLGIKAKLDQCLDTSKVDFLFLVADRSLDTWNNLDKSSAKFPATADHRKGTPGITRFQFRQAFKNGPTLHEIAHQWANYYLETYSHNGNSQISAGKSGGGHWGVTDAGGQLGGYQGAVKSGKLYQLTSPYVKCNSDGTCPIDGTQSCIPNNMYSSDGSASFKTAWASYRTGANATARFCHQNYSQNVVCIPGSGKTCAPTLTNLTILSLEKVVATCQDTAAVPCARKLVEAPVPTVTGKDVKFGGDFTRPNGGFNDAQSVNNKPYSKLELYLMGLEATPPSVTVWENITFYDRNTGAFIAGSSKTASPPPAVPLRTGTPVVFKGIPVVVTLDTLTADSAALKEVAEQVYFFTKQENPTDADSINGAPVYNFFKATGGKAILKVDGLETYKK